MKGPETQFRTKTIQRFKVIFGRCDFISMNPPPVQGFPDVLIIGPKGQHIYLEFKAHEWSEHQPNQDFWIKRLNNGVTYARFIYPENQEEIRLWLIGLLI